MTTKQMRSSNRAEIEKAFTQQEGHFESAKMNFSNREYLDDAMQKIAPNSCFRIRKQSSKKYGMTYEVL